MADDPESQTDSQADSEEPSDEPAWRRRRRLADVFGDVLPETTSDERDSQAPPEGEARDGWLRRQVPPHHG